MKGVLKSGLGLGSALSGADLWTMPTGKIFLLMLICLAICCVNRESWRHARWRSFLATNRNETHSLLRFNFMTDRIKVVAS